MSTEIATIKGECEGRQKDPFGFYYDESKISITRFWGGEKGEMLQITISGKDGYSQITREQAKELSKLLIDSFDLDKYPNE